MIKRNLKWKINSQRDSSKNKPKSISIESSPRNPIYLIRREDKSKNSRLKSNLTTYTKYVLHSNFISPASSPNTSKIIRSDEQRIGQPKNNYNQERKHSLSTLSTENRSFKNKFTTNNHQFQTESVQFLTHQFTEQNQDIPVDNQIIQQNIDIDIECSHLDIQQKRISQSCLFDDRKKKQLKQKMQNFEFKDHRKANSQIDQVIKLVRTIKQPSYRYEAQQRSSRIWLENMCFQPVELKQYYTDTQNQFKFYFSQYFDKHLKLYRIIEINNQLLKVMNNNQQIIQDIQEQRKAFFRTKIYNDTNIDHFKTENLFRFYHDIQTYGMINFLNEDSQLSITSNHNNSQINQIQEIKDDQSEQLDQTQKQLISKKVISISPKFNISLKIHQFKLTLIISELDLKSKNNLLSVDYTTMDQQIYMDNINQIVPTFQEEFTNPIFFKVYSQYYNQVYKDILNGNFCNTNPIDDLEFEAPNLETIENGSNDKINGIDKRKILISLKKQKNWQSGTFQKQNQLIDGLLSQRASIQVFPNRHGQESAAGSPELPQINILQNLKQFPRRKSFSRPIHSKNFGDNILSIQKLDSYFKNQNDTSQDSVSEINKITISKSQQQFTKQIQDYNLVQQKTMKKQESGKDLSMVSSIKFDSIQQDSISDSNKSNKQQINLQNKNANPQSVKLETLLLYDQMIKTNRSKKKIVTNLIEHGLLDQFQEFMDVHRNFNLNGLTEDGTPFISLAAANGNKGIVKHMLNFNVNINQIDKHCNTPLQYAMLHNNFDVADLLLQHGANPSMKL
ncbi:unnamed protein product [Paramecium octaurelia]|uniref:Ankyrin repeat protein n=1 Tax=Paramecium octaurelia TaxID=43137 RepID=A0A8S1T145_PAROT|nr:unnamed protein product [Paramecium octaurelia]